MPLEGDKVSLHCRKMVVAAHSTHCFITCRSKKGGSKEEGEDEEDDDEE